MAVSTNIYDKNGVKHAVNALYEELPYFFKLISDGIEMNIAEPIGFSDIEFIARRDKDWHGFNYEHNDDEFNLKFNCESGSEIIKASYGNYGNDGLVYLQYGVIYNSVEIIEFEYKLDLNTYVYLGDNDLVQCQVEVKSLHELIRSRWDTKLNLLDNKDLDGSTITPIPTYQLPLQGKEIEQNYENVVSTGIESDLQFVDKTNRNAYIIFDSNNPAVDEIAIIPKYPLGIYEGTDSSPVLLNLYFLKAENAGSYRFNINHQFQFNCNITRHNALAPNVSFNNWWLRVWFTIVRANGAPNTELDVYEALGGSGGTSVSRSVSITQSIYGIDLREGDKVFYYCHFGFSAAIPLSNQVNTYVHVVNVNQNISVNALTKAKTSFSKTIMIGDALKRAFELVTNRTNVVKSSFYSPATVEQPVAGCGSKYVLTNGFQLRNFDIDNRPVKVSLSELLNSLNAYHNLGISYEYVGTSEVIKIEKAENFYSDNLILSIEDNVQNYQESAAKELIYNQIEVGYEKFLDEGSGGLNDFHTKQEYQTPIKSYQNKFSILSKFIASGELIEQVRREQFSEKPKDSTSYDDNIFIVAILPFSPINIVCSFEREDYDYEDPPYSLYRIRFETAYSWLYVGSKFIVAGSANNNGQFTITQLLNSTDGYTHVLVSEVITTETNVSVSISFPNTTIQAESAEAFTVTGVETDFFYNLRLTPKRMLLNHAKFINSGLIYKSGSDFLKQTDIKGNTGIITQMKTSATCAIGDAAKAVIAEKGNIFLANFDGNEKIFSPEFVNFETSLTREQVRYINNALRGRNADSSNYGYIQVKDPAGAYQKVYINEMKFNPVKSVVKFSTVKKKP